MKARNVWWFALVLWVVVTALHALKEGVGSGYRESLAMVWLLYIMIRLEELEEKL